jgi:hypothetical protein
MILSFLGFDNCPDLKTFFVSHPDANPFAKPVAKRQISSSEFCCKGFETGNRVVIEEHKNAGENVRPFKKAKK